ncbi:MAG: protein kinase [Coriobacteriia bacterium]|nr:protein kinase [Coriobacteriia bacterium]
MDEQYIGPYELRGEIGRGAMARVWRAWDPNLEREVAIKEPLLSDTLQPEVREEMARRFVKEAKAAARLNHPNVVGVYVADIYDGRPAIVMELVEGATLGKVLEASNKLEPSVALSILDDVLDGIGYAHSQGVVHRDLKPDNIFITADGHAKIGDFGIAHLESAGITHATQMGTVLGTPGYMSPEQARGSAVDGRGDLFSVGVIAYEMLTGVNPFASDEADATTVLYRIVHEEVPAPSAVGATGAGAQVDAAILAALSKDPADRPATAQDLKAALHGGALPIQGARSGVSRQVERANRPQWLPYVAVVAVCVLVVGGIFFAATSSGGGGGGSAPAEAVSSSVSSSVASSAAAVTIPDVTGLSEADAKAKLEAAGLVAAKANSEYSDSVAKGSVASQSPSGGKEAKTGDTVGYALSDGPAPQKSSEDDPNGYILSDSSSVLYSTDQLNELTTKQLCLARNEIYARHGYSFETAVLQEHFDSKSWYSAKYTASTWSESSLNSIEKENIQTIRNLELARNSPYMVKGFQW